MAGRPVYLEALYRAHPVLGGTPSVFRIQNLAYQGLFDPDWLPRLDLPCELGSIDALEFWGRISFLKGGINYAEVITTVSPLEVFKDRPKWRAFQGAGMKQDHSWDRSAREYAKIYQRAIEALGDKSGPKTRRQRGRPHGG